MCKGVLGKDWVLSVEEVSETGVSLNRHHVLAPASEGSFTFYVSNRVCDPSTRYVLHSAGRCHGERLCVSYYASHVYVHVNPVHVIECLGEADAEAVVISMLDCPYYDEAAKVVLTAVIGMLGVEAGVRLAVRSPSLAVHLSPEAACVYAETFKELSDAWCVL